MADHHPIDHYPEGEGPTSNELRAVLAEVVTALRDADVRFLLMGGVGSAAIARPRITDDIDVFVAPEDARRTLDVLEAAGFDVEEYDPHWLFKAWKHGVLVDVIFRSLGDIYLDDEMLRRSRVVRYKGTDAPLIPPEDLLVIKAVATSEDAPHHWYDALGIVARVELDWDYLLSRARAAGPRRVLSLLLYAESSDLAVPTETVDRLFTIVHPEAAGALDDRRPLPSRPRA